MIKDLFIPDSVRLGIRPLKDGFKDAEIWGADFETVNGKPYTMQIRHPDGMLFEYLPRPDAGLAMLLDLIHERKVRTLRVYWWSLSYDLPCLLFEHLQKFLLRDFKLAFRRHGCKGTISVSCDRSWFARIRWGKRKVEILDAYQFFRMGLAKAAEKLPIGRIRKLPKPRGLGSRCLTSKAFEAYAKIDAEATYRIALLIEKAQREWDISACVSASQFASKVLRKHFLPKTIPYIPTPVEKPAVLSYHGGANWVTEQAPCFIKGVTEYDLTSAYPDAFCQLPNFASEKGAWVRTKNVPPGKWGFVKVAFRTQCSYYGIRGHSFECLGSAPKGVWTTCHEYHSSRDCLCGGKVLDGWWWKGGGQSPFADYMNHFFKDKANAKNEAARYFAKICLNGISGKLVQNREMSNGTWKAGGLWNPALASLVTGHTRARMHTLLHRHDGFHCATDSLFTKRKGCAEGKGMGSLHASAYGDLLLLRNKLYLFFTRGSKSILKWGAHGFWGTTEDLMRLWKTRTTEYTYNHIFKVREAFAAKKKKRVPLKMVEGLTRDLAVCWAKYTEEMQDEQA